MTLLFKFTSRVKNIVLKNRLLSNVFILTDVDYLNQLEDIQGLVCIGKCSQEDIETYKKDMFKCYF